MCSHLGKQVKLQSLDGACVSIQSANRILLKGINMRIILLAGLLASSTAFAQDVYVVSVQPRFVTTQQQQCQQVAVQGQDNSMLGTVIGGVAGGIVGNQVGGGSGKTTATALGAVVGAFTGNNLGGRDAGIQQKQVCTMVPVTVQQGEIVTFNYKGRQFTQAFN
jgi:uncharacterized protein YcfJ